MTEERELMFKRNRDKIIADRSNANMREFMDQGSGLRCSTRTWVLARGEGRVLLGGLGGMGIGIMWCDDTPAAQADPTYADAPFDPSRLDHFGRTAGGRREIDE